MTCHSDGHRSSALGERGRMLGNSLSPGLTGVVGSAAAFAAGVGER